MSGGSMDYLYLRVLDAQFEMNTLLRIQFRNHLNLVADALRAIEWNDSGDGADNEAEGIRAVLCGHTANSTDIFDALVRDGEGRN